MKQGGHDFVSTEERANRCSKQLTVTQTPLILAMAQLDGKNGTISAEALLLRGGCFPNEKLCRPFSGQSRRF